MGLPQGKLRIGGVQVGIMAGADGWVVGQGRGEASLRDLSCRDVVGELIGLQRLSRWAHV